MILSHRHRFIFLHCRKVAGSSITAYLNRHLGPGDLQIGAWEETLRAGGGYNRRFYADLASREGLACLCRRVWTPLKRGSLPKGRAVLHAAQKQLYQKRFGDSPAHPAAETLRAWAPDEWRRYFKFCFVRNPYAQAVSDYLWRTRKPSRKVTFTEFLKRLNDAERPDPEGVVPTARRNWDIYTIDGRVAVDFVGRMENLFEHMEEVCARIGVPFDPASLPHAKRGGAGGPDYRSFYTARDRRLVESIYAMELQTFGYEFEG